MTTHVASNPSNTTNKNDNCSLTQESSGTSYAHAVLNLKCNDNSNKENINEAVKEIQAQSSKSYLLQENSKNTFEPLDNYLDDGESFTPVVSHSRKERKNERSKRDKFHDNNTVKPIVNGNSEKRDSSVAVKEQSTQQIDKDEAPEPRKVFVEAPLPKFNPWQANRNAAQVLATTDKPVALRVLQPQKQYNVNGQGPSTAVQAPKDRQKYKQKVSVSNRFYFFNLVCMA